MPPALRIASIKLERPSSIVGSDGTFFSDPVDGTDGGGGGGGGGGADTDASDDTINFDVLTIGGGGGGAETLFKLPQ